MFELQTDLLEWLQQRKRGRSGIGIHGAGLWSDEVELPGTPGCILVKSPVLDLFDYWSYGRHSSTARSKRLWFDEMMSGYFLWGDSSWRPKDKFDKHKPKEIRWDSVPEDWTIPYEAAARYGLLAWSYCTPEPRKIHQGSARYIKR